MKRQVAKTLVLTTIITNFMPVIAYANPLDDNISSENIGNVESNVVSNKTKIDYSKDYPNLLKLEKDEVKAVDFGNETMVLIDKQIERLDEVEKKVNYDDLLKVVTDTLDIHLNLTTEIAGLHEDYDQFDYIFIKTIYLGFTELKGEERDKYFIKLSDEFYASSMFRINKEMYRFFSTEYSRYLGYQLGSYFENKEVDRILNYGASMSVILDGFVPSEENKPMFPENELPSNTKPTIPGKEDEDAFFPPDEDHEIPSKPESADPVTPEDGTNVDNNDNNSQITTEEYVAKNNNCHKITYTYTNKGDLINQKDEMLPNSQKELCNIYDYEIVDGDNYDFTNNVDSALDVWESLGDNELNNDSKYSLQYTLNKENEKPYYYDSGIKTTNDMTATYTQIRDVLIQISLKINNGYIVEDTDKLLFIAEGKPLIVINKNKELNKTEIESLFKNFKTVGLTVNELQNRDASTIDTQLSQNELNKVMINNEEHVLKNQAVFNGNTLQLPVAEIAELLGFKSEVTKTTLKLINSEKNIVVEYELGTKNIVVNNNKKIMSSSSQVKDGIVYAETNLLLKELSMSLQYDSNNGTIAIK